MFYRDWKLGVSTYIYQDHLGVNQLEVIEESGITYFELACYPPCFNVEDKELIEEIRRYLEDSALECWSLHSIFRGNNDFSVVTGKEQDSALVGTKKCIEVASRLGVDKVVVHPNGGKGPLPRSERPRRLSQCKEGLAKLVDFVQGSGVTLAVENNSHDGIGNRFLELKSIISDFSPELVGVCMDINHIFGESIDEFVTGLGKRIITLHLSDHDGQEPKHWVPMEGVIDWQEAMSLLQGIDFQGSLMYEARPKVEGFQEQIRAIKENYGRLKSKYLANRQEPTGP